MTEEKQLLFDFWYTEPEQNILEGVPHFESPLNDNERLLEYQYQYKVNGDKTALDKFYRLGVEIAGKYISQMCEATKRFKGLSIRERREKAQDAIVYIVTALIQKPNWFIKTSVTGYLYLRAQHELKYYRKVDKIVDFVDFDTFFKEGEEDEDE